MTGFLETIAVQTFSSLISNLATSYISSNGRSIKVSAGVLKADINENLNSAYNKCMNIKTILSENPVNFLSVYTDQIVSIKRKECDQYDVVDKVKEGESCCIIGTGGGGKSMLIRYLWLSVFENPEGKIPFFLELRNLNSLTHDSIEDFIYHSIIATGSKISQVSFEKAVRNGEVILFLDGFDEINHDLRENYERKILDLKENNPNVTIVVTSRPDDRFSGWHQFHNVNVVPLKKASVIELIDKADFYSESKKLLISKINDGLYETHTSFLSNPLLAYMMLVTISYNSDIPVRMFNFYEHAFEALYHRHDLTKSGFKRKFHCALEKQEFIRLLSYFSLITYHKEKYEFSEAELISFVEKSISVESVKVKPGSFIKDIEESLCILKREGLEYSFTHRSFQEYFSAYCLTRVASKNIEAIFSNLAFRYSDQVLGMIYDIDPFLFREKYIIPLYNKYGGFFKKRKLDTIASDFMGHINGTFVIRKPIKPRPIKLKNRKLKRSKSTKKGKPLYRIALKTDGEFNALYRNIDRLVAGGKTNDKTSHLEHKERRQLDNEFVLNLIAEHKIRDFEEITIMSSNGFFCLCVDDEEICDKISDRFAESPMYSFVETKAAMVRKFVNSEKAIFNKISNNLDDLF